MTYQEFKEAVIGAAKAQGITEYEIYYTESESTTVEIFKEEVKGYGTESSLGVCFRCVIGERAGYAATENLTAEEAVSLVARAVENAESIESDQKAFIHKKGDDYAVVQETQGEFPSGAELVESALALQKKLYQADSRVVDGTQAYMAGGSEKYALYNSNGLDLEDKVSYAQCFALAIVKDGEDMYDGSADKMGALKDFDLDAVTAEAVEDAVSTIGAGGVDSGKYSVVFSGKAMAKLLMTYASVFSAEEAQKGLSLLKDKEGEKIAADCVTIIDDPRYPDSVIKRTFDGEGVATYAKNVVEKGTLNTLLHNLATADKAGVKSTGNASKPSYSSVVGISPFTFYVKPGEGKKEELFAKAGSGIYVTNIEGLHSGANAVTGDFSLAASGFLLEDGKKTTPVKGFTVADNFFTFLKKVVCVGEDLELVRGRVGSPSVLVEDITVGGK
ncbi:MAG: TldD/PmbA family protein [Acetatifactor sp.]|nr:TldD/PmbA family protein [Acetatifactor sp.]